MIALDTNILLRFIVRDHEDQAQRSRRLIAENRVFVSTTVLLETEWVLRSGYGFSPAGVSEALFRFIQLENVNLENAEASFSALEALSDGYDFADALHIGTRGDGIARFATFDRQLIKKRVGQSPDVFEP